MDKADAKPIYGYYGNCAVICPPTNNTEETASMQSTGASKGLTFIDLFSGVGGIRLGMESQGFHCVMSSEINEEARKTYAVNFGEIPKGDITKIDATEVPQHDILCAGFPCQPFSISGRQKGFADTRGTMFFEVCRILEAKKPEAVLLENVKHLVHHDKGRTLSVILSELQRLGYHAKWQVLNAVDFGVPQSRERIIIVGSRSRQFSFSSLRNQPRMPMSSVLDKEGDFDWLDPSEYTLIPNPKMQAATGLIFAGYRNKGLRKKGVRAGSENLSRAHRQTNRIYSVLGSHPTIPSQEPSGRFFILTEGGHVRKLTIDECWRLMGFPESFKKISPLASQYRQAGNSVCVPMISAIAHEIKKQLF